MNHLIEIENKLYEHFNRFRNREQITKFVGNYKDIIEDLYNKGYSMDKIYKDLKSELEECIALDRIFHAIEQQER